MTKIKIKDEVIPGIYDFVFKELVIDKNNREWLSHLLSNIIDINYEILFENIVIKDSRLRINNKLDKKNITDIIIEVDKNYINLEMNNFYYKGITERNNAYHAAILKEVYKENSDYLDIEKVIQINFNNYKFNKSNKLVSKYMITDVDTLEIDNEIFVKYSVNLPNLKGLCYNLDNNKLTELEKCLLLLVEKDIKKLRDISKGVEYMEKVVDNLERLSLDEHIIGLYDKEEEDKKIERTKIRGAKEEGFNTGFDKGCKEGLKKGVKQGIKKGIKQGIEEGFEKGRKSEKIATAKNMIKEDIPIEIIRKCTKLSIDEINSLK